MENKGSGIGVSKTQDLSYENRKNKRDNKISIVDYHGSENISQEMSSDSKTQNLNKYIKSSYITHKNKVTLSFIDFLID